MGTQRWSVLGMQLVIEAEIDHSVCKTASIT
jgi:hypothetical protein